MPTELRDFWALYTLVGRGTYYGSFIVDKVWLTGAIIIILVMATAFLGYVLLWG